MINGDYILTIAPPEYPGYKYRGKYCYEHRLVWWKNYGFLPNNDEVIHHKDENKHNNNIENLVLMTKKEHVKMHDKFRLKKYSHPKALVKLLCPGCQKVFIRRKYNTFLIKGTKFTCCCKKCIGITTGLMKNNKEEYNRRIANNLIKEYKGIF